ncbi:16S rRNA (adenine(1518)-N(6)/adenine(1519)-N(6))-dimethyltransferase RsmA [Euzebya sp.]|uniref:16S rRNA (adenine(1518)-N(6)/adenine(1519)-N(6))- dimethyltransferase RsmA n=1 Tax=Euzebya sp. TaxID=1971409 RepID=UPI003513C401
MGDAPRPLLGRGDVRRLLAAHGLHPTKRRGQNFVVDPNTVRRIVRDAGVAAGDLVVEVGPGLGSLTLALLEAGARVVAVELDHGLAAALADVVGPGVEVRTADAVAVDYDELTGGEPAVMVANLPYNVATPIVLTALRQRALAGYHVMVQREVGERWVAAVGDPAHGAVSVKIALLADARIAGTVSRQAFWPVPNVDSVTVDLRPHDRVPADAVARAIPLVDAGFAQRRKRLRNALAGPEATAADVEALLERADIPRTARAEELDLAAWLRLADAVK